MMQWLFLVDFGGQQPWFSARGAATMSKGGVEIYDAMPPSY